MPADVESIIGEAERLVAGRVGAGGAEHQRAAAETAAALARSYGAPERLAYLAGLLHDWARDVPGDELLAEAERRGLDIDPVEREVPYLLHAQVGARQVLDALPDVPPEVVRAVALHTIGAPGMSPLEQVVFLADMLEPGRRFPGVEELREEAGSVPLARLFLDAYSRSLGHVLETRRHLHPAAVPVWNWAVAAVEGPAHG